LPAAVTIASGGTVTVTIEVTAISTGTYTNTLTVLVPAATINLGATQSAVAGTVVNVVNITPSKLVGSVTVAQGLTTSFTLVVGNAGPSTLTSSIQDTLPSQFTTTIGRISSAVNGSASTANFSLTGSTFAGSVTIASGGTVTVTIEVTAITSGSYTNTLTVLIPAGTSNNGSTTATVAGTVTSVVNIAPSKAVGSTTVAVGNTTSFTLVVGNAGPSTLTSSIQDTLPSQFTTTIGRISSAVNGSASTANFSLTGSTFAGSVTIASGGTVTVTIEVTAITSGSYTNTLTVLIPAGTSNNGSTTATVAGTVTSVVNIAPSKAVGSTTVAVGNTTSFTLVVGNAGPSTLTSSIQDTLPSQFTTTIGRISSAVNGSASTANFSLTGSTFAGSVTIASGGTVTVTIEVTAITSGSYTNTLTVLIPAGTSNNGSTTATVAGTVTSVVNIAPSKAVGSTTVAVGNTTSFTLVVGNAGPSTLTSSIQDTLPSQFTTTIGRISSAVNGSASTANFSLTGSTFAGSVTIASGGTVTVTIEVTAITSGSYTNTLTVLIPAGTSNNGSTTATVAGTVTSVVNIAPSKAVGSTTVAQWPDTTSFTLVVSNAGPSHADKQHQRHACPAKFTHHDRRGWLERGQRKREHGQLQRLTGSGTFAGSGDNRLGRHGDGDDRGDGDQRRAATPTR
jgi:uncharacterized repeat protein (TIGR01451 family)